MEIFMASLREIMQNLSKDKLVTHSKYLSFTLVYQRASATFKVNLPRPFLTVLQLSRYLNLERQVRYRIPPFFPN